MKNIQWTTNALLTLFLLVGLAACQQQSVDPQKEQFQAQAQQALGKYARRVSAAYAVSGKQQSSSGIRGFWGSGMGGWNPFGGDPFGGQVIQQNIQAEIQNCVKLVKNIPVAPQNYYFMIASLGRCLDVVISYRNPLYTMAFRNLDPTSQYYWSYLLNYSRPGTFGAFPQQDHGMWSSYANWGLYGSQW